MIWTDVRLRVRYGVRCVRLPGDHSRR